jgi:hypothetical protein
MNTRALSWSRRTPRIGSAISAGVSAAVGGAQPKEPNGGLVGDTSARCRRKAAPRERRSILGFAPERRDAPQGRVGGQDAETAGAPLM